MGRNAKGTTRKKEGVRPTKEGGFGRSDLRIFVLQGAIFGKQGRSGGGKIPPPDGATCEARSVYMGCIYSGVPPKVWSDACVSFRKRSVCLYVFLCTFQAFAVGVLPQRNEVSLVPPVLRE